MIDKKELERKIEISAFNKQGIIDNVEAKLSKNHLGKGKVALTLRAIILGCASVWEVLYAKVPLFSSWVAAKKSIIDTYFFDFLSRVTKSFSDNPNLEGLTPKQIYELGVKEGNKGIVNASISPVGQIFSAILQFVIEHPTVTILSGITLVSILGKAFQFLIDKIKNIRDKKIEKKIMRL